MLNLYKLTLTNGVERLVTREEDHGKSIIGLWIWARKQRGVTILDFNECVVDADHIMMIDRPEAVAAIDNEQDTMLVHRLDNDEEGVTNPSDSYISFETYKREQEEKQAEVDPAWFLTAKEGSVKEDED